MFFCFTLIKGCGLSWVCLPRGQAKQESPHLIFHVPPPPHPTLPPTSCCLSLPLPLLAPTCTHHHLNLPFELLTSVRFEPATYRIRGQAFDQLRVTTNTWYCTPSAGPCFLRGAGPTKFTTQHQFFSKCPPWPSKKPRHRFSTEPREQ